MAAWTTPQESRLLRRRWKRGDFLTALAEQQHCEPIRHPLTGPRASKVTHNYEAVRVWAQAWETTLANV